MKKLLLVLLLASSVQAESIKVRMQFQGPGVSSMAHDAQVSLLNGVASNLQTSLAKVFKLGAFESGMVDNGFYIVARGDLGNSGADMAHVPEDLRKAALDAAAGAAPAKLGLSDFRIEVEDGERHEIEREIKKGRQQEEVNREKARPQPRLNIDVKDKVIEDLTILEVPLVRVMDRLGAAMPFAYVLHPEVVGRAVFVRLINVTLDEALAAIAESAQVKIEKREKYIAIVPLPPTK